MTPVTTPPPTYSPAHLRRQRDAHARVDGYGRHRHLYLHARMARLAADLRRMTAREHLTWLDYGCGKGEFLNQIRPLGLFATFTGYDPAVDAFRTRPDEPHDLVTCLDVLDVAEAAFLDQIVEDVRSLASGFAVFDCLTRPKPNSGLRPHAAFYWTHLIRRHMDVIDASVEYPGLDGFERAVIVAAPLRTG